MTAVNGLQSLYVTQKSRTVAVTDKSIYSIDERLVERVWLNEMDRVTVTFRPFWTLWSGKIYRNSSESGPEEEVLLAVSTFGFCHLILELQNWLYLSVLRSRIWYVFSNSPLRTT
jgi:hypothetical protein